MAEFLSDEWLAELAEELRGVAGLEGAIGLRLGQVVTGYPPLEGADLAYCIFIGGGEGAAVVPGSVEDAEVVLVEDYETARAIASGTPAGDLLAEGRIKVRGDAAALTAAYESLTALGDALTRLSATTHFPETAEPEAEGPSRPVLERAAIEVTPGAEEAFLAAFPEALAVILSAQGCRSARLLQGVESPSSFLLLVEWESLEAHMEGFRSSPLFVEWRRILGPFFAAPPAVEHYSPVQ